MPADSTQDILHGTTSPACCTGQKSGEMSTRLGRCSVRPGHLGRLGPAILAGLNEKLDLLALGQAAEAFGDYARLQPRERCHMPSVTFRKAGGHALSRGEE